MNILFILIPVMLVACFMMKGKGGGCCGGHEDNKAEMDDKKEKGKHGCC